MLELISHRHGTSRAIMLHWTLKYLLVHSKILTITPGHSGIGVENSLYQRVHRKTGNRYGTREK